MKTKEIKTREETLFWINYIFMDHNDIDPLCCTVEYEADDYDDIVEQIVAEYLISKGIIKEVE